MNSDPRRSLLFRNIALFLAAGIRVGQTRCPRCGKRYHSRQTRFFDGELSESLHPSVPNLRVAVAVTCSLRGAPIRSPNPSENWLVTTAGSPWGRHPFFGFFNFGKACHSRCGPHARRLAGSGLYVNAWRASAPGRTANSRTETSASARRVAAQRAPRRRTSACSPTPERKPVRELKTRKN